MDTQSIRNERIDIRITPEEKKIFLRARKLSGDRSLSAFITRIVKTKAFEIIEENERILASKRDRKIFFDAIFADVEPNQALTDAAKKFKSLQE
ncbi:MAG: DUF1778 domain-containing protein [Bacteroidetes bacterium]|nr:DUF1778 domain-containing protein [Bacteroidota bacterium]MBU1719075.1 DUF1778 domain-containing protein [Bacteroidota bacterium]